MRLKNGRPRGRGQVVPAAGRGWTLGIKSTYPLAWGLEGDKRPCHHICIGGRWLGVGERRAAAEVLSALDLSKAIMRQKWQLEKSLGF